jgi:predicted dehydrogenase
MEKARIGIVGLGSIAQTIHLPILSKFPDVEIVAVCDLDRAKAQFVADKFKVRRYYNNFEKMMAIEQDLDGIDICTPTILHKDMAIAALGEKNNVLIEKPLARTSIEAEEIAAAAKKFHQTLMVGMNNRFRPDTMILKSFIEDKALGKLFYAKAGWFKKLNAESAWLAIRRRCRARPWHRHARSCFLDDGIPRGKRSLGNKLFASYKRRRGFIGSIPQNEKRFYLIY